MEAMRWIGEDDEVPTLDQLAVTHELRKNTTWSFETLFLNGDFGRRVQLEDERVQEKKKIVLDCQTNSFHKMFYFDDERRSSQSYLSERIANRLKEECDDWNGFFSAKGHLKLDAVMTPHLEHNDEGESHFYSRITQRKKTMCRTQNNKKCPKTFINAVQILVHLRFEGLSARIFFAGSKSLSC